MKKNNTTRPIPCATLSLIALVCVVLIFLPENSKGQGEPFQVVETTIEQIHSAYESGTLTASELVQLYIDRIVAYDQQGPNVNSIIALNPDALREAEQLDAMYESSGPVGPLHGIPVILKDQVDVAGMATTLGSILFEDYYPDRDAFVTERLRAAGAIILAKSTLGELAGGDTHSSLFGSTRNPYALDRTVGGSSGGSGASIAANFGTVSVGQESFASIRRPAAWNMVVGMRTSTGLVSRGGVFAGWPEITGTLGPMARTVTDLAILLDGMVGYDPEDPLTAYGVGHIPDTFTAFMDRDGLEGARLGVLRESIGRDSEPESEDFAKVDVRFNQAIIELEAAGAIVVDPIVIPNLTELLSKRASDPTAGHESFQIFFGRSASAPFASVQEMIRSPNFGSITGYAQSRFLATPDASQYYEYLIARNELMVNLLKVMADNSLDAIVYKAVEHQPTLIEDGINPPFVNTKGVPYLNTFLVSVPAIVVPAGFTDDDLPVGITFMGRPYEDGAMLRLAYAYEQATHHRKPPGTTPPLP